MFQYMRISIIARNMNNNLNFLEVKYARFIDDKGSYSFGILPNHMPYFTVIKSGTLLIELKDNVHHNFKLSQILITVNQNQLDILADQITAL